MQLLATYCLFKGVTAAGLTLFFKSGFFVFFMHALTKTKVIHTLTTWLQLAAFAPEISGHKYVFTLVVEAIGDSFLFMNTFF